MSNILFAWNKKDSDAGGSLPIHRKSFLLRYYYLNKIGHGCEQGDPGSGIWRSIA